MVGGGDTHQFEAQSTGFLFYFGLSAAVHVLII
jgi:hypothetical protein